MIIVGDMSGKAGEILADAMMILYIVSIVHPFLVRKSYLKKYDMILRNNEVELEREKTKRAKESLERANEIKNIEDEAKKVAENLKANEQAQVEGDDKRKEETGNDIELEKNNEVNKIDNGENEKNRGILKRKKFLLIIPVVIIAIVIAVFSSGDKGNYLDVVKLTDDSYTGAEFDLSFKEAKAIIGKELGIGDLNSNGGWQKIENSEAESRGIETYGIAGTTGVMGAQVAVNTKTNNVLSVILLTNLDVSSCMNSFCKVFQKSLKLSESKRDTLAEIFTDIENQDGIERDAYCGVIFYEGPLGDLKQLSITAASEEFIEQQRQASK